MGRWASLRYFVVCEIVTGYITEHCSTLIKVIFYVSLRLSVICGGIYREVHLRLLPNKMSEVEELDGFRNAIENILPF